MAQVNANSTSPSRDLEAYINRNYPDLHVIDGTVYPQSITPGVLKEIKELVVREDDVWIATFPKSGTKWCVDIVTRVLYGRSTLDTMKMLPTLGKPLEMNFPLVSPPRDFATAPLNHRMITRWESPRILTTHLSINRLPEQIFTKKSKILYVIRNPKDVVVSFHRYINSLLESKNIEISDYCANWSDMIQAFLDGTNACGSWWDHVLGFWRYRKEQNFLILTYENMKQDPSSAVRQIAEFLGVTLDEDQVSHMVEATSFENMKKRAVCSTPSLATHFRKGEVGDWKNYFTIAESKAFDEKIQQWFENTDIKLQF